MIAQGRLQQRSYQDREGNNRVSIEMTVEEVGPSMRYATAQVTRTQRGGSGGGQGGSGDGQGGSQPGGQQDGGQPSQAADAWATPGEEWTGDDDTPF